MEKTLLIFFLSFISCGSSNLKNVKSDFDNRIILAYNYVAENYDSNIIVSNSFANIDIVNFAEEISKKKNKKMSIVLDSLIKIEEESSYIKKKYPIKALLNKMNNKGNLKLFFSKPKGNYIMVEVFKTDEDTSYERLTVFGSSDIYLLYFKDEKIIDKYKIKLDYN
jgi:hypothetical protein